MRECINKFTPIFGVSNRAQITGTHTNFKYVDQSITRLLQENERMRSKNNCFLTTVGIGSQTESNLDHLVMLVQLGNSIQDDPTTFPTHGAFIRLDVNGSMFMNFNITVGFNGDLLWIGSIWISCHESHRWQTSGFILGPGGWGFIFGRFNFDIVGNWAFTGRTATLFLGFGSLP